MERKPMNQNRNNITLAACVCVVMVACSCASLYRGVVTLTAVVDEASKTYASAYNSGLVTPDLAAKVATAHLRYRESAGVARDALKAYKLSGDPAQFNAALDAAKAAADAFIAAIVPLITSDKAAQLRTQIKGATRP